MNNQFTKAASFCLVLLLSQTAFSQDRQVSNPSDFAQVNSIFSEINDQTPGISVAVSKGNQVVFKKSFGCASLQNKTEISSSTVFSLASVSKQFTAFAILLLESEGKLSLDDDVRKFIPELPEYGTTITLRHLAHHTSGLRSHLQLLGMKGMNAGDMITEEMVHQMIFRQKSLNFETSAEFNYCNSGYVLLAEVVSRVSGLPFAEYLSRNILKPLKMNSSFAMVDFKKPVENLATSYNRVGNTYTSVPTNDSYVGSTGVFTTIDDLAKWVENFDHPKVGDRGLIEKMNELGVLKDGSKTNYAWGQMIEDYRGIRMIHHAGGDAGFVAFVVRFPEQELSVMLLGNCSSFDVRSLALRVADCFLEVADRKTVSESVENDTAKTIVLSPTQLNEFAGRYIDVEQHLGRKIEVRGSSLVYSRPEQGGRESILVPLTENEFRMQGARNVRVNFLLQDSKRLMQVTVDGELVEQYSECDFDGHTASELSAFAGRYFSEELDVTYALSVESGTLQARVPRVGAVPLEAIKANGFCASGYPFSFLEVVADADSKKILGLKVSSDRVKDVFFNKIDE